MPVHSFSVIFHSIAMNNLINTCLKTHMRDLTKLGAIKDKILVRLNLVKKTGTLFTVCFQF